jgi:hypothetical protein
MQYYQHDFKKSGVEKYENWGIFLPGKQRLAQKMA